MIKHLWAILLVSLCACATVRSDYAERAQLWQEVARPTVRVAAVDNGGSGSGIIVYQDDKKAVIITAAHVVTRPDGEPSKLVAVALVGKENAEHSGHVAKFDKDHDLALVVTDPGYPNVARVITYQEREIEDLGWGSRVMTFGYPVSRVPGMLTEGRIASVNDEGYMTVTSPIFYGNSGGGIFAMLDDHWTLIGVAQAMYVIRNEDRVLFATHIVRSARTITMSKFLQGVGDVR